MNIKFGATGKFPQGQLGPDDEGELRIGIAHDSKGTVLINFGKEVSWLGMPPPVAIEFAKQILKHAGVFKISIEVG
jgi:hypothetical protein